MLEKVARSSRLFREDRQSKLAQIFEPLCDYFSKSNQFVIQFQTLITILAYLRQIKLIETYPDNYTEILSTLSQKIVELISLCNAETVSAPVESLTILARTDRQCA